MSNKTTVQERVLANIVRAEIKDEEGGPTYVFSTASEASVKPFVSEGAEKIHRVKNTILGAIRYEDILLGYEIKLVNNTFSPELLALIDGGQVEVDDNGNFISYSSPVVGETTQRKSLMVNLYTEEVDCDGEIIDTIKFSFKHAKGKPVEYTFKDGEFFVPELTLRSRAKSGESGVEITEMSSLS